MYPMHQARLFGSPKNILTGFQINDSRLKTTAVAPML